MATHKFIVLSLCTFGIYELYWCYQNWKRLKDASGEELSPFWRAFCAPLWCRALFNGIRATATSADIPANWSSGALGALYFILHMAWRLPDPWWLISLSTFMPMIPVQQAAQRVNERYATAETERPNNTYSPLNIVVIIVGGLCLILSIIGTLIPA